MFTDTSSLEDVVLCVIVIILILQYYTLCNAPVSQLNQLCTFLYIFELQLVHQWHTIYIMYPLVLHTSNLCVSFTPMCVVYLLGST